MRLLHCLAAITTAMPAAAQSVVHTHSSSTGTDALGAAVAIWSDFDGDGLDDWAVGAPHDSASIVRAGRVDVVSSATGLPITTYRGSVLDGRFGHALARIGDLDGDGRPELAIGAPGNARVVVLRGATGQVLWSEQRPGLAAFGSSVAAAGDVDGDGVDDVVVGAPGSSGSSAGRVVVLSGVDGATVFSVTVAGLSRFGHSVASAGDVDADGLADVVAGAPLTYNDDVAQGAAVVLRGPNGALWHTHLPTGFENRGQEFGSSVAPLGDLDGDGRGDYAVGARWYGGFHYIDDSFVAAYSGATHLELWRTTGSSDAWFGHSMANVGDVDADGFDDLAVGDPLSNEVRLVSPTRNVTVFVYEPPAGVYAGASVCGGSDTTGDGFPEIVQGSTHAPLWTAATFGTPRAQLLSWGCPPDAVYAYCETSPNSSSPIGARIGAIGSTSLGANALRLFATDCPTNTFALFFHGNEPGLASSGFGLVCVGGSVQRLYPAAPTGSGGVPTFDLEPATRGFAPGETAFFQCWLRDNQGGAPGFNFSDGLRVTFCQ